MATTDFRVLTSETIETCLDLGLSVQKVALASRLLDEQAAKSDNERISCVLQ